MIPSSTLGKKQVLQEELGSGTFLHASVGCNDRPTTGQPTDGHGGGMPCNIYSTISEAKHDPTMVLKTNGKNEVILKYM